MVNDMSQESGYVALLTVIITGAIATAVALTLLLNGTDLLRSSMVETESVQARGLATACIDEGLQKLHDNIEYTGSGTLSLGGGSCQYTITATGLNIRSIATIGTVQDVVKKVQAYVTINLPSINITSWQEVN